MPGSLTPLSLTPGLPWETGLGLESFSRRGSDGSNKCGHREKKKKKKKAGKTRNRKVGNDQAKGRRSMGQRW